jgi:hypothetical protein
MAYDSRKRPARENEIDLARLQQRSRLKNPTWTSISKRISCGPSGPGTGPADGRPSLVSGEASTILSRKPQTCGALSPNPGCHNRPAKRTSQRGPRGKKP